jgi:flavin-dependent dehydrogenase
MIAIDPIALAALIRHPEIASALRDVLAGAGDDELIPLTRLAEQVGSTREILWDEGRRGRLRIEGPRCARVVRRSERDRWLASEAPKAKKAKAKTSAANDTIADERADVRAAVRAAAARAAR